MVVRKVTGRLNTWQDCQGGCKFIKKSIPTESRRRTCQGNTVARSRNNSCRGNAISRIHLECVSSHTHPVCSSHSSCCDVICGLPGSTVFFHIISQTGRFSGKVTEHKMCVLILSSILSETFLILRRTERDIVINVHRL